MCVSVGVDCWRMLMCPRRTYTAEALSAAAEHKFHTYKLYLCCATPIIHTYISHPHICSRPQCKCGGAGDALLCLGPSPWWRSIVGRCWGMPWRWLFAKLCGRKNGAGNGREKKVFFNGDSSLCPPAGQGVLSGVRPGSIAAEQPVSLSACLSLCMWMAGDIWFSNCEKAGALFF